MLYSALWAYQTSIKTAIVFSPFQLVYGMEAVLPIECQIPSLKLAVQLLPNTYPLEEQLVHLEQLNEQSRDEALANEAHKHNFKCQYDRSFHPRIFFEGDLVLVYDQDKDPLGAGKFKPMWFGPFIIKEVLKRALIIWLILKGMLWRSLEMGSTSRSITHRQVTMGNFL
jgi:hypothetical protein